MNTNLIFALVSGAGFATWPLILNRCGMTGLLSTFVYSLACALGALPFALYGGMSTVGVKWGYVAAAAVVGVAGLLAFNSMLAGTTRQTVNTYFLTVIVFQTTIVALNAIAQNGWTIGWQKGLGLILAIGAVYLLTK